MSAFSQVFAHLKRGEYGPRARSLAEYTENKFNYRDSSKKVFLFTKFSESSTEIQCAVTFFKNIGWSFKFDLFYFFNITKSIWIFLTVARRETKHSPFIIGMIFLFKLIAGITLDKKVVGAQLQLNADTVFLVWLRCVCYPVIEKWKEEKIQTLRLHFFRYQVNKTSTKKYIEE